MATKRSRRRHANGRPPGTIGSVSLDGERILQWRLDHGISQQTAAEEIGIATMTYRRCETSVAVNLLNAAKVARYLKVPLEELKAD